MKKIVLGACCLVFFILSGALSQSSLFDVGYPESRYLLSQAKYLEAGRMLDSEHAVIEGWTLRYLDSTGVKVSLYTGNYFVWIDTSFIPWGSMERVYFVRKKDLQAKK